MGVDMRVSGSKITWKAQESTFGMTEECIKGSTKMTKSTVMESTPGPTDGAMKATGLEESSMVLEPILFQRMAR